MITNLYDATPWPVDGALKRQSPGIAIIGRTWPELRLDRVPYLIGHILHDLADEYPIVLAAANYTVSNTGQLVCKVRLVGFLKKMMPISSVEWQSMGYFTHSFLSRYRDRGTFPTQYIECDRSGFYAMSLCPPKLT